MFIVQFVGKYLNVASLYSCQPKRWRLFSKSFSNSRLITATRNDKITCGRRRSTMWNRRRKRWTIKFSMKIRLCFCFVDFTYFFSRKQPIFFLVLSPDMWNFFSQFWIAYLHSIIIAWCFSWTMWLANKTWRRTARVNCLKEREQKKHSTYCMLIAFYTSVCCI